MSADVDQLPELVRIRCPECGTETTVSSEESREKLHTHDEKRHDGERTAGLKVRTDDGFRVLPHPDDVATDGGHSLSGTDYRKGSNSVPPHGQLSPVPIIRTVPSGHRRAACGEPQAVQTAAIRSASSAPFIPPLTTNEDIEIAPDWLGCSHERTLHAGGEC